MTNATTTATGAWTAFKAMTPSMEAMKVFEAAMKGMMGGTYTPVAVSTQVVAGTNYRFFCNFKGAFPNAVNESKMVEIFQPLSGEPHVVSIHPCK